MTNLTPFRVTSQRYIARSSPKARPGVFAATLAFDIELISSADPSWFEKAFADMKRALAAKMAG